MTYQEGFNIALVNELSVEKVESKTQKEIEEEIDILWWLRNNAAITGMLLLEGVDYYLKQDEQ